MQTRQECFGIPNKDKPPVSEVWVNKFSALGSTNTGVILFINTFKNIGRDITYRPSSSLGDSFYINTPGVYNITLSEAVSTICSITLNSTSLSTSIPGVASTQTLAYYNQGSANGAIISAVVNLSPGDVIRAQSTGLAGQNDGQYLRITRVA